MYYCCMYEDSKVVSQSIVYLLDSTPGPHPAFVSSQWLVQSCITHIQFMNVLLVLKVISH